MLELVRLFCETPSIRLRVLGRIAAGEPIEAADDPEDLIEIAGPAASVHHHPLLPLIREYLCPPLQSLSGDAFEAARVLTPLLAGLAIWGKVPIDLDPWLFSGLAILIGRMGVAGFCADHATTKSIPARRAKSGPTWRHAKKG